MAKIVEIPVVWLQGGACTGCAVSLLNSLAPSAARVVSKTRSPGAWIPSSLVNRITGMGSKLLIHLYIVKYSLHIKRRRPRRERPSYRGDWI